MSTPTPPRRGPDTEPPPGPSWWERARTVVVPAPSRATRSDRPGPDGASAQRTESGSAAPDGTTAVTTTPEGETGPGPAPEGSVSEPAAPEDAAVAGAPAGGRVAAPGRTLVRRRTGRMLGGVAGGLADHLEVDVRWVRAAFVALTFLGWAGVLAYALLWIFLRQEETGVERTLSRSERLQAAGLLTIGLGLSLVATTSDSALLGWIAGPLGLATIGAAVVWREADEAQRRRWARDARSRVVGERATLARTLLGAGLVAAGVAVFLLGNLDLGQVRFGLLAAFATLLGVAVLTVPWWVRLARDLGEERRARAVQTERMEIAAHLHDSVLQTLALIQRQSDDSREVARLARGQERELRSWLYGPAGRVRGGAGTEPGEDATLSAALTRAAAEVEDTYAVAVGPVLVGDAPLDADLRALVLAAREAMVNAAKHAGVAEVDVYAEVEPADEDGPGTAEVFVRDRGRGFDPDAVGDDRHGLADSVHERMRRHGGSVRLRTAAGEGTEVRLSMPLEGEDPR